MDTGVASTKNEFRNWLANGNAKQYLSEDIISCIDNISDYAIRKKFSEGTLWEYANLDGYADLYRYLAKAQASNLIDIKTYNALIISGKTYARFHEEKLNAFKEAIDSKKKSVDKEAAIHVELGSKIEEAITWMITQVNAAGAFYKENAVRSYMLAVKNAPQKLVLDPTQSRDVFGCNTVAEIDRLIAAFKAAPNYLDINTRVWGGQLSTGLKLYRRYMQHLEKINAGIIEPNPAPHERSPVKATNDIKPENPEETSYVDFQYPKRCLKTKPLSCVVSGNVLALPSQSWAHVLVAITNHFIAESKPNIETLNYEPIYGKKVFLRSPEIYNRRTCVQLSNGQNIYTHYNSGDIILVIRNLCHHCNVGLEEVKIAYYNESKASAAADGEPHFTEGAVMDETPKAASLDNDLSLILADLLSLKFNNGFLLEDRIEMDRLRSFAVEKHKCEFTQTDYELKEHINAIAIVINGKAYLVPKEAKANIKSQAESIFESGAQAIFYQMFYSENKKMLLDGNVSSVDLLENILRSLFPNMAFFKDYFSKTETSMQSIIASEILRVWGSEIFHDAEQLSKLLPNVPLKKLESTLQDTSDFIAAGDKKYTHISKIEITNEEIEAIKEVATRMCDAKGYALLSELPFGDIEWRNDLQSKTAIQSVIYRICLLDKFDRKGKIITRKGGSFNAMAVFMEYCRSLEKCTLDDLLDFRTGLMGESKNHSLPLEVGYSILVRISKEKFVADRHVSFNVESIDIAIEKFVNGDYLPLKSFFTFVTFPYCGQSWNLFLLESYCRRFSEKFRFDAPAFNSMNAGAVIRKDCTKNYLEIMADAVENAGISLDKSSVALFLHENGYISKSTNSAVPLIIDNAIKLRKRRD